MDRLTGAMLISPKKCLKLVLVYIIRYKNKPKAVRNKAFRTYVDSKALTLKSWKWNCYLFKYVWPFSGHQTLRIIFLVGEQNSFLLMILQWYKGKGRIEFLISVGIGLATWNVI